MSKEQLIMFGGDSRIFVTSFCTDTGDWFCKEIGPGITYTQPPANLVHQYQSSTLLPMLCPRGSCNSLVGHTDGAEFHPIDSDAVRNYATQPNGTTLYDLRCPSCSKEWQWGTHR